MGPTRLARSVQAFAQVSLVLAMLSGCGGSSDGGPGDTPPPPPPSCTPACLSGAACISGTCSTVTLSTPLAPAYAEGVYVVDSLLLAIQAQGREPNRVDLSVDGLGIGSGTTGATWVRLERFAPGPHVLEATARYGIAGGGFESAAPVRLPFVVDLSAPVPAWDPEPGVVSLVGVRDFTLRAGEPLAPVFAAQDVEVTGSSVDDTTLPAHETLVDEAAGTLTIRFAGPLDLVNGLTIKAHVTDRAGNPTRTAFPAWTQPPLRVSVDPPGPVWTNGPVRYSVTVEGGRGTDATLEFSTATDSRPALVVPLSGSPDSPYSATVDTTWLGESVDPWLVRARIWRGRATFVSEDRLLFVDRRRPAVWRCGPRWSAIEEAYVEEPLVAEFTEAMSPSTMHAGISVRGGAGLPQPIAVSPAPDGRGVEIRSPPDGSGSSFLTIGETLTDLAGNPLAEPATCLVRYPEWQLPGRDDASFPKGTGGPHLVLGAPVAGQGFPPALLASEWGRARLHALVDGHWSNQWVSLPTLTPTGVVEGPALGGSESGELFAAWVEVTGAERRVLVARKEASTWTWIGVPLNGALDSGARQVTVAADAQGRPVAAWIEDRGGVPALVARRWEGSSWADLGGGSMLNASASQPASAPRLVVDASGLPVLAWREAVATGEAVLRVRRWTGQGWTDPLGGFLAGTARSPSAPSLALDAAGQPVVAWSEPEGGVEQVLVSRWNGTSWTGVGGPVSPGAGQWARSPSLAIGPGDVLHVAVIQPGARADEVHVLRFDGAGWVDVSGPLNLDTGRDAATPWLAVDPRGRPAVAWLEGGSFLGFRRYNR